MLLIDVITQAVEKSAWFNEPWFIKLIEKVWVLFPAALLIEGVRKWIFNQIKRFGIFLHSQYTKLRILKRISDLEKKNTMDAALMDRYHNENTVLMNTIMENILEVGRTAKRISLRQRIIENTLGIAKTELSDKLMLTDCTNDFLDMLDCNKEDVLGYGYKNYIYIDDRELFSRELEIVKNELRENNFYIRMVQKGNGFLKYGVRILPILCIKNQFIGCSIIFRKI